MVVPASYSLNSASDTPERCTRIGSVAAGSSFISCSVANQAFTTFWMASGFFSTNSRRHTSRSLIAPGCSREEVSTLLPGRLRAWVLNGA